MSNFKFKPDPTPQTECGELCLGPRATTCAAPPSAPPGAAVAVALSGGLDSLMAACILKEQGHRVLGVHARFIAKNSEAEAADVAALQKACDYLGLDLHVLDLRGAFQNQVIEPFMAAYVAGKTPNPCALCNPRLKFGLLMDAAERLGAPFLATGHYARLGIFTPQGSLGRTEAFTTIFPAHDPSKDQSYFLALVPPQRLARAIFPLHGSLKKDLAQKAQDLGLPVPQPKESQEICFVPNDDYRAFLQAHCANLPGPGPMLLQNGAKLGTHKGLWQYTEGQRRGLGIAWSEPLYVLGKNLSANSLLLGPKQFLDCREVTVGNLNILIPPRFWPEQITARVRYRQRPCPAKVVWPAEADNSNLGGSNFDSNNLEAGNLEAGQLRLIFQQPEEPPAKGQLAALYHPNGCILAGGIIE